MGCGACNPSTQEAQVGGLEIEARLNYIVRLSQNNNNNNLYIKQ
jgi:hypothetical protein